MSETKETQVVERPPEPVRIPLVSTSNSGRINTMMDNLSNMYESQNSGMKCRWVYSPEHRSDLSNVLTRRAQGYLPVVLKDMGQDIPGFIKPDDPIRVGDVVLMGVATEVAELLKSEIAERARNQVDAVEAGYYESTESMSDGHRGEHRARPRGRSVIEERDLVVDQEQRTS